MSSPYDLVPRQQSLSEVRRLADVDTDLGQDCIDLGFWTPRGEVKRRAQWRETLQPL